MLEIGSEIPVALHVAELQLTKGCDKTRTGHASEYEPTWWSGR